MIVRLAGYLNKNNIHRMVAVVKRNLKKIYEVHFKFVYQAGDNMADIPYVDCINQIYFSDVPDCSIAGHLIPGYSIKLPLITRTRQAIVFNQNLILDCTMFLKVSKLYGDQKNLVYCPDICRYCPEKYAKYLIVLSDSCDDGAAPSLIPK